MIGRGFGVGSALTNSWSASCWRGKQNQQDVLHGIVGGDIAASYCAISEGWRFPRSLTPFSSSTKFVMRS